MEPRGLRDIDTVSPSTKLDSLEEVPDEEGSEVEEDLGLGETPVKVKVKKEKDFVRKLAARGCPQKKRGRFTGYRATTRTGIGARCA